MPPQCPGTREQTYLDELISIPKGSGVGATRLREGGGWDSAVRSWRWGGKGPLQWGICILVMPRGHSSSTSDPAQASHSPRLSVSMLKFSRWRN